MQSWCLLCMQTRRVEEKRNMKYSSLCKDIGYIIVFVPMFVLSVFVKGIRYIDVQNLQRGVLEMCVTASDVLFPTAFPLSTNWKMSSGSQASASSASPPSPPPSPSASASDLTLEGDLIDADATNVELPEPSDVQSKLPHALAALCMHHSP